MTTPESPRRAQWNAMRDRNSRPLPFWRKVGLWSAAWVVMLVTETRWRRVAIWTAVFAVIVVAAMLLGPGH